MTGSRRWFEYESNAGVLYAVELDESNAESNLGGIRLFSDLTAQAVLFPKRASMRYVNASLVGDPLQRRRFWVGEPTVFNAIAPGDAIADGSAVWRINSVRGEKFTIPSTIDSGLIDGDTPN
jgi:hypothetical protein